MIDEEEFKLMRKELFIVSNVVKIMIIIGSGVLGAILGYALSVFVK